MVSHLKKTTMTLDGTNTFRFVLNYLQNCYSYPTNTGAWGCEEVIKRPQTDTRRPQIGYIIDYIILDRIYCLIACTVFIPKSTAIILVIYVIGTTETQKKKIIKFWFVTSFHSKYVKMNDIYIHNLRLYIKVVWF